MLRRRFFRMLLTSALVAGSATASAATAGTVLGACSQIWTGDQTSSRSTVPAKGFTYTSSVTYELGYDSCNLTTPNKILIVKFSNKMAITGSDGSYHTDMQGAIDLHWTSNGFINPTIETLTYADNVHHLHSGNGTWTRTDTPNKVQTYYQSVAILGNWTGCSQLGGIGTCRFAYRFRDGVLEKDWTAP